MEALWKDLERLNKDTKSQKEETHKQQAKSEKNKRMKVKEYFKSLDTNKDGKLDDHEFFEIVRRMGEIWTLDEIKTAISQIDRTNSGSVSFADFFLWWTKESDPNDTTRLNFLKLKLKSDAYVKSLSAVAEKFIDAQLEKPVQPTTEVDFSVTVGEFKLNKSSVKVSASTSATKYNEIVKQVGASSGDSCAFVSFDLTHDADIKAITDTVAKINLGLAVARKVLPIDKGMASVETGPDGNKQLVVSVILSGKKQQKLTELVKRILSDINFSAEVAFDQAPSDPLSDADLNLKVSVKGKVPHSALQKENAKYIKKIPSIGRDLSEILTSPPFTQLFPLLEFGGFDLQLGGLTELVRSFANIDTKDVPEEEFGYYPVLSNWAAIKEFFAYGALKTVLKEKKFKKHILPIYFSSGKSIKSVAKITVASQQTVVELLFNNFNLMDVLPTKEYLGFESHKGEELVVDDIKLLHFSLPKEESENDSEKEEEFTLPKGPGVILGNDVLYHTFDRDEMVLFEYAKGERFTLNHVMVKSSRTSKNPVKDAFFWAFDEKPKDITVEAEPFKLVEKFLTRDENDRLVVPQWPPKEEVPGLPFAHVRLNRNEFYGEYHLEKPVSGKYIVAFFPDSWECKRSRDKSTVQYVGFAGPAEKPKFKTSLFSKFGLK